MEKILMSVLNSPQVKTLLALIAIDILTGVSKALKEGEFDLCKISQFYMSMVIPYLIGYASLAIFIPFAIPDFLGPYREVFSEGLINALWLMTVGSLGSSIHRNLEAVFGEGFDSGRTEDI